MSWWRREAEAPEPPYEPTDDLWAALSNVSEWIRHSETKLGAILAFVGVTGAGLYSLAPDPGKNPCWLVVIASVTALALGLSGGATLLGLVPRRRSKSFGSLVYYRDVARDFASADQYADTVENAIRDGEFSRHITKQIHANSGVAETKFDHATFATVALAVALLGLSVLAVLKAAGVP